jgi:hypothetical protein
VQRAAKKKKLETSWQLPGLLHPVHGAIREQLQICQRAAQPWLLHVTLKKKKNICEK